MCVVVCIFVCAVVWTGVSVYVTLKVNMVMLKVAIAMVTGGLQLYQLLSDGVLGSIQLDSS